MTTTTTIAPEQTTAVAAQAVELYGEAWAAYILAALLFLAIVIWFTRKGKAWWRIPLWAAIAAGSLTPATTISDQHWHSPAIIVAILGYDLNGMAGFAQGVVPIVTWFVGFVLLFAVAHLVIQRLARKVKNVAPVVEPPIEQSDARQEPKL